MLKRKAQKKIEQYREKIRCLEQGEQRKRRRIIYSDSSDGEQNADAEQINADEAAALANQAVDEAAARANQAIDEAAARANQAVDDAAAPAHEPVPEDHIDVVADVEDFGEISADEDDESLNGDCHQNTDALHNTNDLQQTVDLPPGEPPACDPVSLDKDILAALGESTAEGPKFGPKIHENLARLWSPILLKGLGSKEMKEKLIKPYLIPENCPLLQSPKLNPEISAALSDASRFRDKRVESVQQHLGYGITAINRALTLLIEGGENKLEVIKLLSDSCRILCDVHHGETQARKKFFTPGLDKSFLNVIQDVDHDDTLFGNKLSEKIKASKVIEKQGLQIKNKNY
ncbi:hypothetical protein NE865_02008 [Phthorimaea operculella]|nr:hypothetical protein NE865_02008 [Phthorimaea operculella]